MDARSRWLVAYLALLVPVLAGCDATSAPLAAKLAVAEPTPCVAVAPRPLPPPPTMVDGVPTLHEGGLGDLSADDVVRLPIIERTFPRDTVERLRKPIEMVPVARGGEVVQPAHDEIQVEGVDDWILDVVCQADGSLERIELHGPLVTTVHGLRVGDRYKQLAASGASSCEYSRGEPEYVNCVIGSSHIDYVFFVEEATTAPAAMRGPLVEVWLREQDPAIDMITWEP